MCVRKDYCDPRSIWYRQNRIHDLSEQRREIGESHLQSVENHDDDCDHQEYEKGASLFVAAECLARGHPFRGPLVLEYYRRNGICVPSRDNDPGDYQSDKAQNYKQADEDACSEQRPESVIGLCQRIYNGELTAPQCGFDQGWVAPVHYHSEHERGYQEDYSQRIQEGARQDVANEAWNCDYHLGQHDRRSSGEDVCGSGEYIPHIYFLTDRQFSS